MPEDWFDKSIRENRAEEKIDSKEASLLSEILDELKKPDEKVEEVSVKNFPQVQKVEVTNFPQDKETKIPAPIVNIPDTFSIREPSWLSFDGIKKHLTDLVENIKKHSFSVIVVNPEPLELTRTVRVVDEKGKPINFNPVINVPPPTWGGGGTTGGGLTKSELINAGLATEATLQAVLAASGGAVYNFILSETGATYKYYGFTSSTGYRVKRKTLSTGVWEVSTGTYPTPYADFDAAWTARASLTYAYV